MAKSARGKRPKVAIESGPVFSAQDVYGIPVVLFQEQLDHIQKRHPEMGPHLKEIKETVECPDGSAPSTVEGDDRSMCYRSFGIGPGGSDIHVLVRYESPLPPTNSRSGMVTTAYPPSTKGSRIGRMTYKNGSV